MALEVYPSPGLGLTSGFRNGTDLMYSEAGRRLEKMKKNYPSMCG